MIRDDTMLTTASDAECPIGPRCSDANCVDLPQIVSSRRSACFDPWPIRKLNIGDSPDPADDLYCHALATFPDLF